MDRAREVLLARSGFPLDQYRQRRTCELGNFRLQGDDLRGVTTEPTDRLGDLAVHPGGGATLGLRFDRMRKQRVAVSGEDQPVLRRSASCQLR